MVQCIWGGLGDVAVAVACNERVATSVPVLPACTSCLCAPSNLQNVPLLFWVPVLLRL